jgi:protein OS-9
LHQSIPEDLHAFPKYRVSFLNGLPVSNETAQKWLTNGLQGGELEFLGQWHNKPLKEIESGTTEEDPSHVGLISSPPLFLLAAIQLNNGYYF